METLVLRASMIRLSLQPSPVSENVGLQQDARLRKPSRRALALRITASSYRRSSALSRTTYRFTDRVRAAIISSIARIAMDKESLNRFRNR
jgi:hypothetical protein